MGLSVRLQVGSTAQWRHWTLLRLSQRLLQRGSQYSSPKMLDLDANGTGRDDPRATPYNTVIKKPTAHRTLGREQSREQWPRRRGNGRQWEQAYGASCGAGTATGQSYPKGAPEKIGLQNRRQADPPSSPLPPGSLGGPHSASLAPRDSAAPTPSPRAPPGFPHYL